MSESESEEELEVRYGSGRIECVIKNSHKTILINELQNIQRHDADFKQRIHCILCGIPSVASDNMPFSSIFDSKGSFSSVAMILHTVSGVKITESENSNENMMCQKCRGQIIALYSARKWLEELQKWLVNHLVSTVNKKRCAKVQVPKSYKSIDFFAQQEASLETEDHANTESKGEKVGPECEDSNSVNAKNTCQSYLTVDVNKDTHYVETKSRATAMIKQRKENAKRANNCKCAPVAFVYVNGCQGVSLPIPPALNTKPGTKGTRPILPKLPLGAKVSTEVQTDDVRSPKKRRRSKNEDDCSGKAKLATARFMDVAKPPGQDGIVPQILSNKSVVTVPNEPPFGELEQHQQLGATLSAKIVEADIGPTIGTTSQKQQDYDEISSAINSWFSTPTTVCQDNAIIPQYPENRPVVLHPCGLDNSSTEPYQTVAVGGVEPSFSDYNTGSFCVTGSAAVLPSSTIFQQSTDTQRYSSTQMVQGQECMVTSSMVTSSMSTSVSDAIISVPSQAECTQLKESTFPASESLYPQHSFSNISSTAKPEANTISLDMLAEVSVKHYTNMETVKAGDAKKDQPVNTVNYDLQQQPQTSKTTTEEANSKKLCEESSNFKMFIRIPGNCKLCNQVFNTGDGHVLRKIQDHMFEHSSLNHNYSMGVMQYTCKGCDNKFNSLDLLKKHYIAKHMIGERFQCLVCNMAYMTFSGLNDHLNCHKGLKPYKCDVCGAEYALRTSLRNHLYQIHKERETLACKTCGKPSRSKHRQTDVEVSYFCRKCKKKKQDVG